MSSRPLLSRRGFLATLPGLLLWPRLATAALATGHAADDAPPALMLANRWRDTLDPAGFWVSEKLDGVRAHWDGRRLRFRSGLAIPAPAWFVAALPPRPLDGELWLGRGRFEELSGIVRRELPVDAQWRALRYMVFDLPGEPGTFGERVVRMRAIAADAARQAPWLQAVEQFRVRDRAELAARLEQVVAGGGEGLMLHRADAHWTAGRGDALLKLTPWLDAEARVVAHVPGKGRLQGQVGALEVEAADGRRFRIGSGLTDAERRDPPRIGAQVTYRYRELTGQGLPRFPTFVRERTLP
jgi:DNA ligase-1